MAIVRMRVLHVHSGNLYGGIETYLHTLARSRVLCPEMEPEFALCFAGQLSCELEGQGVKVHSLGKIQTRYPWQVLRARSRLRRLLRQEHYDVVVCHSAWSQAIFGPAVRRARLPLIFGLHAAATGRHWIERWAGRVRPDFVICNSRYSQSSLASLYRDVPSAVAYLPVEPPNSFTAQDRMAVRSELQTTADAVVIIQVSRIEEGKGHMVHMEALARLRENPNWIAWFVGGPQRPREIELFASLQERAKQLEIASRVRFLGQRNDVPRLLAAADIFCQPNIGAESFGVSLVEALYAGLPVVTSDVGGAKEIVDRSCGVLPAPGDMAALKNELEKLVTSPELRSAKGEAGPCHARQLTDPQTQLSKLCDLLLDVVPQAPFGVNVASRLIRCLPAGRYRAMNWIYRQPRGRFLMRMPAQTGGSLFVCDLRDSMSRQVCFAGQYEPLETAFLQRLLSPGMTFVDVGANWGYFSLVAANRVGDTGRVISLEPHPRMAATLRTNVTANGLRTITVKQVAVADKSGTLSLTAFDETSDNFGVSRVNDCTTVASRFQACSQTLDSVLDEGAVERVDLVKIDVEGAEDLVLAGMKSGLTQGRYQAILLELHPSFLSERGKNIRDVTDWLIAAGYKGWYLDHSKNASREAAYGRSIDLGRFTRPFTPDAPLDAWPHTLWIAPGNNLNVAATTNT